MATLTPPLSQSVEAEDAKVDHDSQPTWPLSFRMEIAQDGSPRPSHWSHTLYRGPEMEKVAVHYCRTKSTSELIAQKFLDEKIIGFDMEWPWQSTSDRLQEKIALIQVASESNIALFHLGLHPGATVDEILAPSLRYIIESENILKVGNNIWSADCSRLKKYLQLKPCGIIELSTLHLIVQYGATAPHRVTTKCVALDKIVAEHLSLPLSKDPKQRKSNWARPLNQKQIDYAASDAYAGFILFHTLDAKRKVMKPIQPLPKFAELGLPIELVPIEPETKEADQNVSPLKEKRARAQKDEEPPLDPNSLALFEELRKTRTQLAMKEDKPSYRIVGNATLKRMAATNPQNLEELLRIKGVGAYLISHYGDAFLATIRDFVSPLAISAPIPAPEQVPNTVPATPPPPAPSTLSKGLSFNSAFGTLGLEPEEPTATANIDKEVPMPPPTILNPAQNLRPLPPAPTVSSMP